MVAVNSTMLKLGTIAPEFSLNEPKTGKIISLSDFKDAKGYLIIFICNHCPYVIHLKEHLSALTSEYKKAGIITIGINSNDTQRYSDDRPEQMVIDAQKYNYSFPYLLDETQAVAHAYKAACTPDFFLFDSNQKLAYRGQYDDTRPSSNKEPTGKDLKAAMEALLKNKSIPEEQQKPAMGCNIKWKQDNEPDYFSA